MSLCHVTLCFFVFTLFILCLESFVRGLFVFFFSSRRRHTRCALVTGVQTCALPISNPDWRMVLGFSGSRLAGWNQVRAAQVAELLRMSAEIGRASCRERVCQYV